MRRGPRRKKCKGRKRVALRRKKCKSMSSMFECAVCLNLMHQPSTLPCGHSFCRSCLRKSLGHAMRCPSCRVDVPYEVAPQTSLALAEAIKQMFPEEALVRQNEEQADEEGSGKPAESDGLTSFPLFVLEPLLPGQTMVLHVFEPRYLRLTERALTEPALDRQFGMIASAPRPSGIATHGVSVKILEHQRISGGRYLLTVRASKRFRVLRTFEVDGYRNASIAWAKDVQPEPPIARAGERPREETTDPDLLEASILASELQLSIYTWLGVVERRGYERVPGEILEGLSDFGPLRLASNDPLRAGGNGRESWSDYERLGLWAAAVINPLPPLGVAPEIRILALEMSDTRARLALVLQATERSLAMISRSKRRLSPDMLRLLMVCVILGGLLVSHTSILSHLGCPAWDTQQSLASPILTEDAHDSSLAGLLSRITFGTVAP